MPSLAPPTIPGMTDLNSDVTTMLAPDPPPAPPPPPWPKRGRRLQIEPEKILHSVHTWMKDLIADQDRGEFYARRLDRYAKYRGWVSEPKRSPWVGCSDVHFPMMQTAELRLNAGLHNVIMTMRPLVSAKATNPAHLEKEDR
ncbi:MAG: hypothetical protein Q8S13_11405, partial [Dehalococcoidia bacterium]|nr:hypothetical protein [Dehalococcoidia bacterium]